MSSTGWGSGGMSSK